MVDKLGDHLNQFTPDFPKEVKLQLPQLKTPKLPQLKKVKFPNL
jgi:hypothetical protein